MANKHVLIFLNKSLRETFTKDSVQRRAFYCRTLVIVLGTNQFFLHSIFIQIEENSV